MCVCVCAFCGWRKQSRSCCCCCSHTHTRARTRQRGFLFSTCGCRAKFVVVFRLSSDVVIRCGMCCVRVRVFLHKVRWFSRTNRSRSHSLPTSWQRCVICLTIGPICDRYSNNFIGLVSALPCSEGIVFVCGCVFFLNTFYFCYCNTVNKCDELDEPTGTERPHAIDIRPKHMFD